MTSETGTLLLPNQFVTCVTQSAYRELNQQLSGEIAQGQMHRRLQGDRDHCEQ
jgi:hypothetical protein